MNRHFAVIAGLLALALCTQGITEKQKLERKRRNIGDFPEFPSSLDEIQLQSQSQIQHDGQWQWQSQSQSQGGTTITCDPPCQHGDCVQTNECMCKDGWSGAACDEFECANLCVHGRCVAPDTCECNSGWAGSSCEEAICTTPCANDGKCSAPDTCTCNGGFTGATCETPLCDKECHNGGSCVAPNTCECPKNFDGTLCQIALPSECEFPFEYNGDIYTTCTITDSTDGNSWCSPTTAYEGNRITCDYDTLCSAPGEFLEIPGDCTHYYVCADDGSISLATCPAGTVFNVLIGGCDNPQNTPHCHFTCDPNCQNDGICVSQNECKCQNGFSGKHCDIVEEELISGDSSDQVENHEGSNVCSIWNREKFYTFDGVLYSSLGRCGYHLISDCVGNTFDISISFNDTTHRTIMTFTYGSNVLVLTEGKALYNSKEISIPSVLNGFHLSRIPNTGYIILTSQDNDWLAWDGEDAFSIGINEQLAGKVCGLCGNMNGNPLDDITPRHSTHPTNDFQVFLDSWSLDDSCVSDEQIDFCGFLTAEQLHEATQACSQAAAALNFETCSVPTNVFEEVCLSSLCQCTSLDFKACMCEAATIYSKLCIARGANLSEWRSKEFCGKQCPSNLVYSECGTTCPATCRNKNQKIACADYCIDGCFCPPGTYLDGETCVTRDQCSCSHLGESYASGTTRTERCEECECNGGSWTCTPSPCQGECSATGDPHYRTFDGLSYAFSGECQYVLATDACNGANTYNFTVIAENVKCGTEEEGTCTKSATVLLRNNIGETKYQLKHGGVVSVGGSDVMLPYSHGNVHISNISSMIILMRTAIGLEVEWDGAMRLYVRLDPEWKNKVCGMCGNFNLKSCDDMKNPQNMIETNVGSFGNSWKVNPECPDVDCGREPVLPEACLASHDKLLHAEEVCGVLKSDAFKPCHRFVDWGEYYYQCRSDVCECGEGQECSCEVLADYVRACEQNGVSLQWRNATSCGVTCPEGMEYDECGGYCGRTCRSIGDVQEVCVTSCYPGCVCHEGLYLTEENTCVEVQDCSCYYEGEMYEPGAEVTIDVLTCTCSNGVMTCEVQQETETCTSPEKYVDCANLPKGSTGIACLPTCQDAKPFCSSNTQHCVSGCACPEGTVKDEALNKCVKPEKCSCSHEGKIYHSGDEINPDGCNSCTCDGGMWSCTEKACPAECSSVGDPHFLTFDGRTYDFQGDCSYVMTEDFCGNETSGSFRVIIETIPCGDNEVTCTKAVTFYLYNYAIHMTKGDGEPIVSEKILDSPDVPKAPSHVEYTVRKGSIYYIVETNIGINILWNAENAVKVQLQPHFRERVCGLCGNFDGDMSNDFQMRAGDVAADPNMFGNDWKVLETCPDAVSDAHPCQANPAIAPWAEKKCNIINSDVFKACHDIVAPGKFYENCLYDTCGCNAGGDCQCFCTSVAAYAQACAQAEVCINWRNNDVCPIMCEAYNPGFGSGAEEECEWKYEPCGNPCPPTCTDRNPTSCPWKQLEGCYVTCKEDEVWDDEAGKCIPEADCPPIPTTTPPPEEPTTTTTTTTKPIPTTTTTTTTTAAWCECIDSDGIAHAPGETWPLRGDESMCVDLTCVEETPGECRTESEDKRVTCTEESKPTCQNGYWPVAVEDGCSCKWECQCYCFGQGDPHFFTFDGFYYPFQGNCTFVLSRDMNAQRSNHPHEYEIWMENVACEEAPETTCTRKMTIRYQSTHLVLYKNYTYSVNGGHLQHKDSLPRNINGIHVEMRGISLFYVTIADINLVLTYTGEDYSWSLSVPYSRYFNRTEGLCGVCNNDQSDDLTNRKGEIETEIEDFGNSWLVFNESLKCFKPDIDCRQPPAKECEIILSDVFEGCHALIDPQQFYEVCRFDTSRCGNYSYCEALYGYARHCDHVGACINWRSDDICPITCPSDRVYEACKPNCERQCSHFLEGVQCEAEEAVEGCFCPPHTVEVDGECVETSICTNCVDVDGTVYEYGESWVPNDETCSICSCMDGQEILCTEKRCPEGTNDIPDCSSCFVPEIVRGSDPCCPAYQCVCNYILEAGENTCDAVVIPDCDVGYIPVRTNPGKCIPEYECQCNTTKSPCPEPITCGHLEHLVTEEGECCPTYSCACNMCTDDATVCGECENKIVSVDYCGCEHYSCESREVCRFNGTDKLPGEKWHPTVCDTCTCQASNMDKDGCYHPECYAQSCTTSCPPCSEYRPVAGQCCGTCVKVGCEIAKINHTASECKSIGDVWYDYGECNQFMCSMSGDGDVNIVTDQISCPVLELITCPTCYRLDTYTDNCCPKYHCIPDDVCCMEGPAIKVPGETWSPDSCTNCQCSPKINETSGFHQVLCQNMPCPSFDEKTCAEIGGQAVPTADGCCMKCDNKCIDNNNNTHLVGEYWFVDNCTICSCVEGNEIVCNAVTCPEGIDSTIPNCGKCEVVRRRAASDPCCPQYDCVCNYAFAQGEPDCDATPVPKCPPGYVPEQTNVGECIPKYDCICNKSRNPCPESPICNEVLEHLVSTETECCPIETCECKVCAVDTTSCSPCEETTVTFDACGCRHVTCDAKSVCLADGILHEVNSTWHPDVCSTCECTDDFDSETSCHYPICFAESCDVRCPACHEYVEIAGQCCGTCMQTGCPVMDANGNLQCANAGETWRYVRNCTEYMCAEDSSNGGLHVVEVEGYTCPVAEVPVCPPCYQIESHVVDCCPQFRCTPQELCCENDVGKLPGSSWAPNTCETCYCTEKKNHTSGFYVEECFHKPCPPIDEDACVQNGGLLVATDDGCCSKCQAADCYECGRRVSTNPEYMVVDECASTEPVSMSYCDGFCRGSYFWSEHDGGNSQCSCCNPTATASHSVTMKCKNGTEIEYQFEDVLSCGCSATCTPQPPTVTPSPEAPVTTTTPPPKPTPEITTEEPEESGSGEVTVTIPEAPVTTTTTPMKTTPTTTVTTTEETEESGSGEVTVTIPEAPVTTTTTPMKTTPTTTVTTTEETEESGSGEVTVTIPEAPVTTTTTPMKTTPTTTVTTTEETEESGSGEVTVTIPEAPVTTTTTPMKTTPTTTVTTTEETEESGSGEVTVTIPEAPVTTTTTPMKTTPTTTITTTEETEESGSGEVTVTIPEAPVTTTTTPMKTTPTTTEEPEESGSGWFSTLPDVPIVTTTLPEKETPPMTTTEEPEESGSGEVTVTIPEAPVTTTTTPEKTTPTTTTTTTTTTEVPEESGSGEVTVTIPEAPVTTTTTPEKTTPTTTTTTTTTTEEPEESGSGEVTVTIPEAPVTTTTTPEKTTPTTTTTTTTTTEEPEESGSGEVTVTIPEAPVTTTTTPEKTTPTTTTTTTTTTEEPEESGSGEVTVTIPEAPVTTTTTPEKTTPTTTTTIPTTTTTTTEATTTTIPTTTTTTTEAATTAPCYWTEWISSDKSKLPDRDDNETYAHITDSGYEICEKPQDIECKPVGHTVEDFLEYQNWQKVSCDVDDGLLCLGSEQTVHPICEDYEIRVYCCPSQNQAHAEVSLVQSQVQHLITHLENEQAPSKHDIHEAFETMHSQEQSINSNLHSLMHDVDSNHWQQGDEYAQAEAQQQMQHQIQNLDHQVVQQSQMQQIAGDAMQGVEHALENGSPEAHQAGPAPLDLGADGPFGQDFSHQLEQNFHQSQDLNVELQDSIHHLIQSQEFSHNSNVDSLMHETVQDMQDLEHSQSNLMRQEQADLDALQNFHSSEEYQELTNMIGEHVQQNQQATFDDIDSLEKN